VVRNGQEALAALTGDPKDLGQQTTVRRVFHTLKGSSRMVGLDEFGEAAWAMEQLLNSWLAEQKPASETLLQLSEEAMQGFARWVEDIAQGRDAAWSAASFRQAADALRFDGRLVALDIPGTAMPPASQEPLSVEPELEVPVPSAEPLPELELTPEFALEIPPAFDADQRARAAEAVIEPPLELDGIDFGSLAAVSLPTPSDVVAPALEAGAMDFDEAVTRPGTLEAVPAWVPGADGEGVPAELSLDEAAEDEAFELAEIQLPELELPPQVPVEPAEERLVSPVADTEDDEQVKVIGSLRIGIPLYNVYLNALAHSLAGSSATVGFRALSEIARALEQALQHVRLQSQGQTEQADIFLAAADNIRHLLHQFAAGFLKEPDPQLLDALHSILTTDFASTGAGVLTAHPPIALDIPGDAVVEANEAAAETIDAEEDFSLDFVSTSQEIAPQPEAVPAPVSAPIHSHVGAAQIVVDDRVDDIDAVDTIDPDLFPIFEEEAAELLPQLSGSLREWSARPENSDARMEVLRVLHTLKGSACSRTLMPCVPTAPGRRPRRLSQ